MSEIIINNINLKLSCPYLLFLYVRHLDVYLYNFYMNKQIGVKNIQNKLENI